MKIIFFVFFAITGFDAMHAQEVHLKGILKGFDNAVEIEDFSEFQYLLTPDKTPVILPDSAGHFDISLRIAAANYFRIGRNALYLTPGDDLLVKIDHRSPEQSVFTGKGSEANNYLRYTPFPKGGSFLNAGKALKAEPSLTISAIHAAGQQRLMQLDTLRFVTKEFKKLESARIRADVINSLLSVKYYYARALKLQGDSAEAFINSFNKLAIPEIKTGVTNFADAGMLKLAVYRDIAEDIILEPNNRHAEMKQIRDWIRATKLTAEIRGVKSKEQLVGYKDSLSNIKTPAYRLVLATTLKKMMEFGKGDTAIDFTATDSESNVRTLGSLKGKLIYIDFWATWCGPCMAEMPAYEKLTSLYRNNPGIVFISVSIDETIPAWQQNLKKRHATGEQWQINRNKLAAYQLNNIPRAIIIDADFLVNDLNAPLPSVPETRQLINKLLNLQQ